MKQDTADSLRKARDFFDDALWNLKGDRYGSSTNRAYYTAFACIQAFLSEKDIYTKTHKCHALIKRVVLGAHTGKRIFFR